MKLKNVIKTLAYIQKNTEMWEDFHTFGKTSNLPEFIQILAKLCLRYT